ncbi:DUF1275 family protein [Streptomyces sp. NPDC058157]|uniref:DUF1275 family protein n=1 Tax=Streptomyces sp. NPDC058157 TaxID=3346360 RepID=UPI0036E70D0A
MPALTAVTGLGDAVSRLRLGRVFVANVTGTVDFLGFALAAAEACRPWPPSSPPWLSSPGRRLAAASVSAFPRTGAGCSLRP